MVTLDNLYITLKMDHSEELRTLDWDGFGTTKTETVRLEPCRGDISRTADTVKEHSMAMVSRITVLFRGFTIRPSPKGPPLATLNPCKNG